MIIAVDTGGTKTLVASFSMTGRIQNKVKFPTPESSDDYIKQVTKAVNDLTKHSAPSAISIALPDITKGKAESYLVEQFSHLPWKNFNVVESLQVHFPDSTIIAANDANLGGLGEVRLLKRPPKRVLYVTISTGVGTGIIIDGKLSNDFTRSEGGHLILEYDGVMRDWDDFGSGKAVYDTYGKYGSEITSKHAWRHIADRISRGFFVLIPVVRPDLVIIGGSMGTHFARYGEQLVALLNEKLPPTLGSVPPFVQAQHPEEAVIYGCYYNAVDTLTDR